MATIRDAQPDDAAAIARVHVDTWRTAYGDLLPAEFLVSLSVETRAERWRRTLAAGDDPLALVLVAEKAAGQVVGIAAAGSPRADPAVDGADAELFVLYVLREHQGRGLGRRLVGEAARRLAAGGARSLILWVLADGPARGFYERLGGRFVGPRPITIGDTTLAEVAYAWHGTPFAVLSAAASSAGSDDAGGAVADTGSAGSDAITIAISGG